jgi:hypothetical protein
MFARIHGLSLITVSVLSIFAFAGSAQAGGSCKTLKCVSCQKQCYKNYYKNVNGPNFNPSTSGIYKRQYYACNKSCLSR